MKNGTREWEIGKPLNPDYSGVTEIQAGINLGERDSSGSSRVMGARLFTDKREGSETWSAPARPAFSPWPFQNTATYYEGEQVTELRWPP